MTPGFVHGETELAAVTGASEKKLREIRARSLRQSTHWTLREQRVVYAAAGAQLVLEAWLGRELQPEELSAALEGSRLAEPQKKVPPLIGKVTKTFPNPWLVQVQLPSTALVNLKVQSSKNFKRGMEVPVRVNEQGVYELARRRCPRFPGRW